MLVRSVRRALLEIQFWRFPTVHVHSPHFWQLSVNALDDGFPSPEPALSIACCADSKLCHPIGKSEQPTGFRAERLTSPKVECVLPCLTDVIRPLIGPLSPTIDRFRQKQVASAEAARIGLPHPGQYDSLALSSRHSTQGRVKAILTDSLAMRPQERHHFERALIG